jgi:hypothetical protein
MNGSPIYRAFWARLGDYGSLSARSGARTLSDASANALSHGRRTVIAVFCPAGMFLDTPG